MKFLLLSLSLIASFSCQKNEKKPQASESNGTQKVSLKEFEAMKNREYTVNPEDLSPSGFHWVHRDLALIYQGSIYQHELEGGWREEALKAKKPELLNYLQTLRNIKHEEFGKWDKVHQMSFTINAYHAYLILGMIERDFKNLTSLSDEMQIELFGKKYMSSDFVKNEILKFNEPRMIFSLKCFQDGCPEFRNSIYNHKNLDNMLQVSSVRFFIDNKKNRFDSKNKTLTLSPYLSKYRAILPQDEKKLQTYLMSFYETVPEIHELLKTGKLKIVWK